MTDPWYMTPAMKELLRLIRLHEGGKAGYNADFRNDDRWTLTNKTFDEFRALGRSQVTTGGAAGGKEPSSALGGYQFLTATLDSLKKSLKLTGKEIMTPAFQDDLAVALMNRRGHLKFLRGEMSATTFANNLAKEWASLPVVSGPKKGRSYYAGDGLNKAFHKPETIMDAVLALKAQAPKGPIPPLVVPAPQPPPVTPVPPSDGLTDEEDPESPSEPVSEGWLIRFFRWLFG